MAAAATMDVCSVPYALKNCKLDKHVLGVSPDGRLRFVATGFVARRLLVISSLISQLQGSVHYDSTAGDIRIAVPQIEVTRTNWNTIKLRWFGEKTGTLIFTVGETVSTCSIFALNLASRSLEKLPHGVSYHACRNLCGYEMDRAALLAWLAPQ
ncbi:hypothetical protein SEVIR_5G366632v4 [Setaria viridis]|uniref:Uncharacterized protein n=1 Tax=Setaria viridis TaxID=4556 RepID=A0A4U6UM02_SETVI|nr:hypothetical protein SEVIR_5G366632v2 [Setaria viridis]